MDVHIGGRRRLLMCTSIGRSPLRAGRPEGRRRAPRPHIEA
jgi:hypothetical protein